MNDLEIEYRWSKTGALHYRFVGIGQWHTASIAMTNDYLKKENARLREENALLRAELDLNGTQANVKSS